MARISMSGFGFPYRVERAKIRFQLVTEQVQSEIHGGVSPSDSAGSNHPRAEPCEEG